MSFNGVFYTSGEITFVIEKLGAMQNYVETQEEFFEFTDKTKKIPKSVIQQIELKFNDKIKRQNELYLTYIDGNPLAHLKIRLDIAYKILQDSLKARPAYTIKTGDGEYETITKADNVTALRSSSISYD